MPVQIPIPERPDEVPRLRFWGSRKPPTNRADVFSVAVQPWNAAGDGTGQQSAAGSVATLRMYGPVDSWGGPWGVSAKDVSAALDSLGPDVEEIRVRINSPGGEAWEGMAILNMLRAHPARIVAVVDGIAASAASFIATGADVTVMSPGTQLMIHDASGFAFGPASTMRKEAEALDSVSDSIASLYAEAAGGSVAEWRALMVEETWYTAAEAVTAKLADRVGVVPDAGQTATSGDDPAEEDSTAAPTDDVEALFDLSIYNYAGRSRAPAPKPPSASASGSSTTTQEGSTAVAFSDEQLTDMRQQLGLPEDADESTIVAALTEALAEQAEPAASTPVVPEGHVVVPEARLRDLEAGARAGTEAANTLREREREEFLDSVRTKFAPTNRAAWATEYDRDPKGTREYFDSAPVIVNVTETGHGQEPEAAADDVVYASLFGKEA